MGEYLLNLAIAGIAACLTHEGGHYLAALCFGERLKFRFEWGRLLKVIPVPRWVWFMPDMASWKQKTVAAAGFGTEFVAAMAALRLTGWTWLMLAASVHLLLYPLYAGDSSDFKWL